MTTQPDPHEHLDGAQRIAEERHRQIAMGFGRAYDSEEHQHGELIQAAYAYAMAGYIMSTDSGVVPTSGFLGWPFDPDAWHPENAVRNLEKAGALIAAEIDRLTRP